MDPKARIPVKDLTTRSGMGRRITTLAAEFKKIEIEHVYVFSVDKEINKLLNRVGNYPFYSFGRNMLGAIVRALSS